jgi:hypothetical protein
MAVRCDLMSLGYAAPWRNLLVRKSSKRRFSTLSEQVLAQCRAVFTHTTCGLWLWRWHA